MKKNFLLVIYISVLSFIAEAEQSAENYKSATRFNLSGQVIGTISPDPDGTGTLEFIASRNYYNNQGLVYLNQKGHLATWQDETIEPDEWQNFTVESEIHYEYDGLGRKIIEKIISNDGSTQSQLTQYSYDQYGRLECTAIRMNPASYSSLPSTACELSAQGEFGQDRITKTAYDSRDRVTQVIKAYNTSLQQVYAAYTYNHLWQQETITDANGNLSKKEYDGFGRLYRWYFPDMQKGYGAHNSGDYEQYLYDQNGNLTSFKKRDGQYITYEYDNLNRVVKKDWPNTTANDVYYSYDLRGLETDSRYGSISGNGIQRKYNSFGELEYEINSSSGTSYKVSYTYDKNGNRTTIKHHDGMEFTYRYDHLDRLVEVIDRFNVVLTTTIYNKFGQVDRLKRANSTYSTLDYDGINRLNNAFHYLFGNKNNVEFDYKHNSASQVTQIDTSNSVYQNNLSKNNESYEVNGLNQYTKVTGKTFTYDGNGNLKSDGASIFTYDVENRLTNASGVKSATLKYDPSGRLYEYTASGLTRRFLYDGNALIAEYDTNGKMTNRYVHGVGADVPLVSYLGNSISGASRSFLHANYQGSIIAISGNSSDVQYKNNYDEYGVPNSSNFGRFGFTGQLYLKEIGLFHYKARTYYPEIGRFLQTDPVGYEDQMNLYTYVGNDPINNTDPSGKILNFIVKFVADVAVGAALNYAETGSVNVGGALADAAEGAFNPAKTVQKVKRLTNIVRGAKRGPKTDPNAPHNAKIREIADKIEDEGGTIIAGGGKERNKPEVLVPTVGGKKNGRRPDILYKDCNNKICAVNVGRTKADGTPVKREQEALDDLNGPGNIPTEFVRYD